MRMMDASLMTQLLQMRTTRIQQTLGLPADKARAIAERWGRYDRDVMERIHQMGPIRTQCEEILRSPASEDEKNTRLKPLLDQYLALRSRQQEARQRFEEDIRSGLGSAQQVRLMLLVEELQRNLRESLRETLREGRGRH
jgi:hypothetical protein